VNGPQADASHARQNTIILLQVVRHDAASVHTVSRGALRASSPAWHRGGSIMRMLHIGLAVLTMLAVATAAAQTTDPNLARNLAATCANCHGTQGVSQGGIESLAGMAKATMISKLQEFKTGARPASIMHQLSKGYTDEQLALIAGWFSEQKAPK
jgi:cytochrome c553